MEKQDDPFSLFDAWFEEARSAESDLPEAMSLATVDVNGRVSSRMVLLKEIDRTGLVFYTNMESRKARDIENNPRVALLFHWKSLKRQIRVEGTAEPVADALADDYFATRPRGAQIGAWASRQSAPMSGRLELEKEVAKATARFGVGTVPRPPFWSGYRVTPESFEFWDEGTFRLHTRRLFERVSEGWAETRLFP